MPKHLQSKSLSVTVTVVSTEYCSEHVCLADGVKSTGHSLMDLQVPETHNSREQSLSREASRSSASQEMSWHFMEPKCSLPHPQKPITIPYPELDQHSL